jgi:hypothetical protein
MINGLHAPPKSASISVHPGPQSFPSPMFLRAHPECPPLRCPPLQKVLYPEARVNCVRNSLPSQTPSRSRAGAASSLPFRRQRKDVRLRFRVLIFRVDHSLIERVQSFYPCLPRGDVASFCQQVKTRATQLWPIVCRPVDALRLLFHRRLVERQIDAVGKLLPRKRSNPLSVDFQGITGCKHPVNPKHLLINRTGIGELQQVLCHAVIQFQRKRQRVV